jgi:hypothetical protein
VWRADRAASTARRDAARGGARRRPRPIYAPRRGALTAAPDGAPLGPGAAAPRYIVWSAAGPPPGRRDHGHPPRARTGASG